ncbi:MAG: bL17 family ribosomal protein [Bacillota bacterium]|jgi:large subunit ribosomal protein L17|nr:bL17 family ribosomal protein [Bacillota bacterium]
MAWQRKLGRPTDQRKAILRNLVTSLIQYERIETTEARAKEIKAIADSLISLAVKECDNFTTKQVKVSSAVLDSKGKKITKSKKSKNDNSYDVVEREESTEMKPVDSPSRLSARRKMISWLYKVKDQNGKNINLANKLMDEIGPRYKEKNRTSGFVRMYRMGPRRGDAAEMVILELIKD